MSTTSQKCLSNTSSQIVSLKRSYSVFYTDLKYTRRKIEKAADRTWNASYGIRFDTLHENRAYSSTSCASDATPSITNSTSQRKSNMPAELSLLNQCYQRSGEEESSSEERPSKGDYAAPESPSLLSDASCSSTSVSASNDNLWNPAKGIKFGPSTIPQNEVKDGAYSTNATNLQQSIFGPNICYNNPPEAAGAQGTVIESSCQQDESTANVHGANSAGDSPQNENLTMSLPERVIQFVTNHDYVREAKSWLFSGDPSKSKDSSLALEGNHAESQLAPGLSASKAGLGMKPSAVFQGPVASEADGSSNSSVHFDAGVLPEFDGPMYVVPGENPSGKGKKIEDMTESEENEDIIDGPVVLIDDGLDYQIPTAVLQAAIENNKALAEKDLEDSIDDDNDTTAKDSPLMSNYWNFSLYTNATGECPTVHYCCTLEESEAEAKHFVHEPILGFDLEWRPFSKSSIKENVSLIQLASESRIALFHVALHEGSTPTELLAPTLGKILADPDIIKTGVSISSDCKRFYDNLGVKPAGLLELSNLHKVVKYTNEDPELVDLRLVGLARQVCEHLLLPMHKDTKVRVSDWAAKKLNEKQIIYAASDAYAGLRIYYMLDAKRRAMDPVPEMPDLLDKRANSTSWLFTDAPMQQSNSTSADTSALADEVAELDLKDDTAAPTNNITNTKTTPKTPPPELALADEWTTNYLASLTDRNLKPRVKGKRHLRAYALWHVQQLDVSEISKISKINKMTAAGYILDALIVEGGVTSGIQQTGGERLEWDKERCKDVFKVLGFHENKNEHELWRVLAFKRFERLWRTIA